MSNESETSLQQTFKVHKYTLYNLCVCGQNAHKRINLMMVVTMSNGVQTKLRHSFGGELPHSG